MRGRHDDGGPDDPICGPSRLTENVLSLLVEAGCPAATTDAVVKLIETWEYGRESDALAAEHARARREADQERADNEAMFGRADERSRRLGR
jgi:hypothetical protein